MAYNKSEKTKHEELKTEKSNRYTFKWSLEYIVLQVILQPILFFAIGSYTWYLYLFEVGPSRLSIKGVIFMAVMALFIIGAVFSCLGLIHHIEIAPDKITIVYLSGKSTVLNDVIDIEYVTKESIKEHTTYNDYDSENDKEIKGLSMGALYFHSTKYGEFTQYCVNYDEIAMVTLANGKKHLINYPRELLRNG